MDWIVWYDYGARFYDPQLGRWHSPDPANQFYSIAGYGYWANNPIIYTDPNGEIFGTFFTAIGGLFYSIGSTIYNFGKAILTEGAIDPWNTKENRQEAWRDAGKSAGHTWKQYGQKTENAAKIDVGLFLHIPGWETCQT